MNIGFIYGMPIYPPGLGGSVHGYQLAKGLAERGHRLMSWYYGDDQIPFVRHLRGRQLLSFLRAIDVLYLRVSWYPTMHRFARLRRLRLSRLPVVWELNGLPQENLYYAGCGAAEVARARRLLRRAARHATCAIGVTETIRDYLRESVGVRNSFVVPNGSDPELFTPASMSGASDRPLRVVWIGTTRCPWHDLETVVAAARILEGRQANIALDIYGKQDSVPSDLPGNVVCHGEVPYHELAGRLGKADVGVHIFKPAANGTIPDGSPLKLFDYMACGLAVVAQQAGQTGTVVARREAGLFTSAAPDDLAQALLRLEGDRALCRRLGGNGRRAVLDYYNWARAAEETERVLEVAVGGNAA
jgi:glycosyltransferase involved in cell wall biosynthesis